MQKELSEQYSKHFWTDASSSIAVFFVALPLCLGISLASGAPLFAGLISGIVGGILVGGLTRSSLAITGPAAGMSIIVLQGISTVGGFNYFLLALVFAGIIQFLLGVLKFGHIGHLIPSSVVRGVMASIGLVLILKQIPHGLGYDVSLEGEDSFVTSKGENTFTELLHALQNMHLGAVLIFIIGMGILIALRNAAFQRLPIARFMPPALLVVIIGILLNALFKQIAPEMALGTSHLVDLPALLGHTGTEAFMFPDFSALGNIDIYKVALIVALIGSIETLVSLEAIEKLDPYKRIVPLNHELKIQGLANTFLGCIGGIPITTVIVRSSANILAGAYSKRSCILHGCWLLISALFLSSFINHIPLASLASILIMVAYKLTNPSIHKQMYQKGWNQFLPFIITILAVLFSDLLTGILIGLGAGIIFTIRSDFHNCIIVTKDKQDYLVKLAKDASFLNKGNLRRALYSIPQDSYVIIDGTRPTFIDADIIETIEEYQQTARMRNITVEIKTSPISANEYFMQKM